jgi:hypothetical protein
MAQSRMEGVAGESAAALSLVLWAHVPCGGGESGGRAAGVFCQHFLTATAADMPAEMPPLARAGGSLAQRLPPGPSTAASTLADLRLRAPIRGLMRGQQRLHGTWQTGMLEAEAGGKCTSRNDPPAVDQQRRPLAERCGQEAGIRSPSGRLRCRVRPCIHSVRRSRGNGTSSLQPARLPSACSHLRSFK